MDRDEALRTLHLAGEPDGRSVESAYWTLVRRAQRRGERDRSAWTEIERLNEAYGALAPRGSRAEHPALVRPAGGPALPILDAALDWLAAEAARTRWRWSGRNPEIALIGVAAAVLMALALGAGASLAAVAVAAGALFVAVWAPWRRVE